MSQSPTTPGWNQHSIWVRLHNITPFTTDSACWHKEWENLLPTLSASRDVYPILSQIFPKSSYPDDELSVLLEEATSELAVDQEKLVGIWNGVVDEYRFATVWYLLEERQRKRHISNGIEAICQFMFGQDFRPLCPEVSFSCMLKRNGRGFVEFIDALAKGKESVGDSSPYLTPSSWWEAAVTEISEENSGISDRNRRIGNEKKTSEFAEIFDVEKVSGYAYEMLTIYRNDTICRFLWATIRSVINDIEQGANGISPVLKFTHDYGSWADTFARLVSKTPRKPIMRCENCTLNTEELGGNIRFMVCTRCKVELDFIVHYCSKECQKADWEEHKKHCGKEKISKRLSGTVNDPFWAYSELPDHLERNLPIRGGRVTASDIGFADPTIAPLYSPALRRQVSLLTADREADYFLFDKQGSLTRVVIEDTRTRLVFRILRTSIFGSTERDELPAFAQYLIKIMSARPGLSKEIILTQLSREYDCDVGEGLASFERKISRDRNYVRYTFVEGTAIFLLPLVGL